jgi:hypothetical protein
VGDGRLFVRCFGRGISPPASGKRSSQAKVAAGRLANQGYCSSKDTDFHGVKLHVVANHRSGKMPLPGRVELMPASEHGLTVLRGVLPQITGGQLYGDKAYCNGARRKNASAKNNTLSCLRR